MRKTAREPVGSAELRAGETRVVIAPSLGGRIISLEMAGREWLWQNPAVSARQPDDDAPYTVATDGGGYDECFPTVGACTIPTWIPRYGGVELPEHGELWSRSTEFTLETQPRGADGGALRARCIWEGERMPYRFERTVCVEPSGAAVMSYAVLNTGAERLPFLWAAQPLMPLTPATRLLLPEGMRVRVFAQQGIELFGPNAEHIWPRLRTAAGVVDLSHPDAVGQRYACTLFFDMKVGQAAVEEGSARLTVTFDVHDVPNMGLWINKRGWGPFRRRSSAHLALAPCIGAPDTLSDALGAWNAVHWLEPGETRRWTLRWSGEHVVPLD
ncbi:MAG TPA: hypothetical protein VFW98_06295 [Gemmatimonadaceae bacterium]|nr:hypothetical protein [Gemmatimonadaceae bacterium]